MAIGWAEPGGCGPGASGRSLVAIGFVLSPVLIFCRFFDEDKMTPILFQVTQNTAPSLKYLFVIHTALKGSRGP